jgi:hypothetical protein
MVPSLNNTDGRTWLGYLQRDLANWIADRRRFLRHLPKDERNDELVRKRPSHSGDCLY